MIRLIPLKTKFGEFLVTDPKTFNLGNFKIGDVITNKRKYFFGIILGVEYPTLIDDFYKVWIKNSHGKILYIKIHKEKKFKDFGWRIFKVWDILEEKKLKKIFKKQPEKIQKFFVKIFLIHENLEETKKAFHKKQFKGKSLLENLTGKTGNFFLEHSLNEDKNKER